MSVKCLQRDDFGHRLQVADVILSSDEIAAQSLLIHLKIFDDLALPHKPV